MDRHEAAGYGLISNLIRDFEHLLGAHWPVSLGPEAAFARHASVRSIGLMGDWAVAGLHWYEQHDICWRFPLELLKPPFGFSAVAAKLALDISYPVKISEPGSEGIRWLGED